jgi:uncharacterized protein (TIGR03437 family)
VSTTSPPGGIYILLGHGNGTFSTPTNIVLPGAIPGITSGALGIGDMNGDGKLDLVVAFQGANGNQVVTLLGRGDGTFQMATPANTLTSAQSIVIVDLNGDGKPDLVLGDCCQLAEASYLIGNGDGTFQAEVQFPSGPSPYPIAAADFTGTGKPDLAIAGSIVGPPARGTLAVLFNGFSTTETVAVVSAANPAAVGIAPDSLAGAFGADLATSTPGSTSLPLPVTDAGTSVSILDAGGKTSAAPLVYVSPGQVNFYVPPSVADGSATVAITSGDGTPSAATVQIAPVAPGVFELNSAGLAAADVYLYSGRAVTLENVYSVNSAGALVANPISLGSGTSQAYLVLYGTGFEAAGTAGVTVTVGGVAASVAYAGPQGTFTGLDQANVLLPPSMAGKGNVAVQLTANGIAANPVNITIQ